MASQSLNLNHNLEGLFNCPWFHGELSREDATEILNEAVTNDGKSVHKRIIFLETKPWSDDIRQNRFVLMQGIRNKGPDDIQPKFYFYEIIDYWNLIFRINPIHQYNPINQEWNVVRKNPFSLQVLAAVKAATCGFNLETLRLPRMIKDEVKKYQDLNERIQSFNLM
jgi:hypothetical protein